MIILFIIVPPYPDIPGSWWSILSLAWSVVWTILCLCVWTSGWVLIVAHQKHLGFCLWVAHSLPKEDLLPAALSWPGLVFVQLPNHMAVSRGKQKVLFWLRRWLFIENRVSHTMKFQLSRPIHAHARWCYEIQQETNTVKSRPLNKPSFNYKLKKVSVRLSWAPAALTGPERRDHGTGRPSGFLRSFCASWGEKTHLLCLGIMHADEYNQNIHRWLNGAYPEITAGTI